MLSVVDKIVALLAALDPEQVAALPPAERRRFADWCRRAASLADPPTTLRRRPGVLSALDNGERSS